ncbi:MAG: YceH family protein [Crocinitomicaceae bacterium]|nr:YceH family protein [Crocinitomicaceae bacterium]MBK8926730.1 YceH family protein [Crocinitomicaceae bacterium]
MTESLEESSYQLPLLSSEEIRVLGALMEKSKTTPDYYPMTLNAITAACNQKSSRNPVVEYDDETVVIALDGLKRKGFVSPVTGGGSRTNKYKHNFNSMFDIPNGGVAALCLLFLRGPLTPGEINSNSGRLHEFQSLQTVIETLNALAVYEMPLVKELPKRPGQKEARYCHLFSATPQSNDEDFLSEEPARKSVSSLENRIIALEQEVAQLKEKMEKLNDLLG